MSHIFLSFALAGIVVAGLDGDRTVRRGGRDQGGSHGHNGHHRQDRVQNGDYGATLAGFYRGWGNATVSDDKVSISATITTSDGQTGTLVANDLAVEGPYFSGNGTVLGQHFLIRGRIDAARASRLTATLFLDDGHTGRIVAKLPTEVDPGDDGWNQQAKDENGG